MSRKAIHRQTAARRGPPPKPAPPRPPQPAALFRLAQQLSRQGKTDRAASVLRRVLTQVPAEGTAYSNLACVLHAGGRPTEVIAPGRRATQIEPLNIALLSCLGGTFLALERYDEGLACFRQALEIAPGHPGCLTDAAAYFRNQDNQEAAIALYRRALVHAPDAASTYGNYSASLTGAKQLEAAVRPRCRSLTLSPDDPSGLVDLGNLYFTFDRLDDAYLLYHRALVLAPDDRAAYSGVANALQNLGQTAPSVTAYRQALTVAPDHAETRFNAAMAHLRSGDFATGWRFYESRWGGSPGFAARPFPQPLWRGEPVPGRTILLEAEQGLGDMLQVCRYIPKVAQYGRVVVEALPPLVGLMADLPGVAQAVAVGDPLPPFDLHCPVMSLPGIFRATAGTIPSPRNYLSPEPGRLSAWRGRLGQRAPRVGLAWSGNPVHANDSKRSLPLAKLLPLVWNGPYAWHVVQKDLRDGDRPLIAATPRLTWHGDQLADLRDTAALVAALDLMITVDTSLAHLAGALGVPTWVMLPFAADWRWMDHRDDSPWYASVRLFRQARPGDWDGVIARIAEQLAATFDIAVAS